MTFEQLLSDLRDGTVPNATQQEQLLSLAEAIEKIREEHEEHIHRDSANSITSIPGRT